MAKPTLVVVGAGMAGARAAKLANQCGAFNVTVVEIKDFFEVPYASVRAIVDPETAEKSLFPLSSIGGGIGKVIRGSVKQVLRNSVILDSGETISFDYAIIATGSLYSIPGVVTPGTNTLEGRKQEMRSTAQRIEAAKRIVVVGGGVLGIEVVGEIVKKYAGKQVTLVHTGSRLFEGKPEKMHTYLMNAMKKHNVQVLLKERAGRLDESAHVLHTESGKQIPADVTIWATGSRPNTAPLVQGGDLASSVDARGRAKVDAHLRLEGASHIFVLGDINDTPQDKLGFLADMQAVVAVDNLLKLVRGNGKAQLKKWAAPFEPTGVMLVTFGDDDGIGHLGSCILSGWFIRKMKGKDMNVGTVRAYMGVK